MKAGDFFARPLERAVVRHTRLEARFRVEPPPAGCSPVGAPIVFLPALGLTQHSWAGVTAALGACRSRVLVDEPGMGEAPVATSFYADEVIDSLADVVEAVAPGKVVIAGHSLGGALAARLAARLGDRVEALVLVAAPVAPFKLDLKERLALTLKRVWPPMLLLLGTGTAIGLGLPIVSGGGEPTSKLDVALMAADWSDHERRAAILEYVRNVLTPSTIQINGDALDQIRAPTLLVWGADDHVVPLAVMEAAATRLAKVTTVSTVIVPKVGHLVPLGAARAVALAIDRMLPASTAPSSRTTEIVAGRRPQDVIWSARHEVFPLVGVASLFTLDGRTDLSLVVGVARGGIDRHFPVESGRLVLTVGATIRDAPWSFAYLRATGRLELVWRWVGGFHVDGTLLVDPRNGHVGGYGAIGHTLSVVPWLRGFVAGGLLPSDGAPRLMFGIEVDARLTGWLF